MKKERLFIFKNVKHSVVMKLISIDENGKCYLENRDYKGLFYKANIKDLLEIE